MRREQKIAMANANVTRKREREAIRKGDLKGAQIEAEIARGFEEDADFWAMTEDK